MQYLKIVTVYQYLSCLPVPYFDVCVCNSVCVMFLFYEWAEFAVVSNY